MAFELHDIVPWGRSFEEYHMMFSLEPAHARLRILGCGDGPASFNAEATKLGWSISSIDPIYAFSDSDIRRRIEEVKHEVMTQTQLHKEQFRWNYFSNPEALCSARLQAMQYFLDDFNAGKSENRYIPGELPFLPFKDQSFDLALVSHLLFLYSEHMDYEFHINAVRELLRVASELRIFPLLDLHAKKSIHIPRMLDLLEKEFDIRIKKVNYEFQKGGNEMMMLKKRIN